MDAFTSLKGIAAPMLAPNIDTDIIMPKQFLKRIDRAGLDEGTFFSQRLHTDGTLNPRFILNQPGWEGASVLVVGSNFGCGSSREYAVWGMQQLGLKALIGTSFAGIFDDNCQRNGVLVVKLSEEEHAKVAEMVKSADTNELSIDLINQEITLANGDVIHFKIDPLRKQSLIEGLDEIGQTLKLEDKISAFEQKHLQASPWLA